MRLIYGTKSETNIHIIFVILQAESALAMLPLPGCEVKMNNERLTFTIKHMERQYMVSVESEQEQIKWMAVLDLASNAVLREKINS